MCKPKKKKKQKRKKKEKKRKEKKNLLYDIEVTTILPQNKFLVEHFLDQYATLKLAKLQLQNDTCNTEAQLQDRHLNCN